MKKIEIPLEGDYIKVVKFFIDNFNFTTVDKTYYHTDLAGQEHKVANDIHWFVQFFFDNFYYINGNRNTTFHRKDLVKFLEEYEKKVCVLSLDDCLKSPKPFICEAAIHPRPNDPWYIREGFFDVLFEENPTLLKRLRESTAYLFIYFGYEADTFVFKPHQGKQQSYYDMLRFLKSRWHLKESAITIINSNLMGTEQEQMHFMKENKNPPFKIIYESALEHAVFKDNSDFLDVEYSIEDYLENIKKTDIKRVLRINRTQLLSRDIMLYFLVRSGYLNDTLIEHSKFLNDVSDFSLKNQESFEKSLMELHDLSKNLDLEIENFLHFDIKTFEDIKKMLPLTASSREKSGELKTEDIFSNSPIPNEVYKQTKVSWVSTSLFERQHQVFLNHSTFKPMLFYHPLLITGNKKTSYNLRWKDYKTYEWFYAEAEIDTCEDWESRLVLSLYEVRKIYTMSEDELYWNIANNFGSLNYNRNLVFECNSIQGIINQFFDVIKPTIPEWSKNSTTI